MRIGKIVEVQKNPDSDKIYMEKIDVGNGEIREISSGLQKFYTLEQMQDQLVVVICNLKAKKIAGNLSHGMVLCCKNDEDTVCEFLTPPEGSQPGDAIIFEGYERKPMADLPKSKNPWEICAPNFIVDENQVGCYFDGTKNVPFATERGICRAPTVTKGKIS